MTVGPTIPLAREGFEAVGRAAAAATVATIFTAAVFTACVVTIAGRAERGPVRAARVSFWERGSSAESICF